MGRVEGRRRAGLAGALLLLAFAPAPGCRGGEPPPPERPGLEARLRVSDAEGRALGEAARGAAVALRLVVTNPGAAPRSLHCASARTHDASITTARGEVVWRWSDGRVFAQVLTEVRLGPGESREFVAVWDQRDRDGRPVTPGPYEAAAWLPALPAEVRAPPVRFRIR